MPESTPVASTDEIVEFEGMHIPRRKVDEILAIRCQGQIIKEGIELEHVHSYFELVREFQAAFERAKRERDLSGEQPFQAPSEPVTAKSPWKKYWWVPVGVALGLLLIAAIKAW